MAQLTEGLRTMIRPVPRIVDGRLIETTFVNGINPFPQPVDPSTKEVLDLTPVAFLAELKAKGPCSASDIQKRTIGGIGVVNRILSWLIDAGTVTSTRKYSPSASRDITFFEATNEV